MVNRIHGHIRFMRIKVQEIAFVVGLYNCLYLCQQKILNWDEQVQSLVEKIVCHDISKFYDTDTQTLDLMFRHV